LVQRLNTELLQSQMKLRAKVVTTMWQWPTTTQAFTSVAGMRPVVMLLKFAMSENH
jgi:hypothetical protein